MAFPFCFEYFSLQDGGELPVPNKRPDATDIALARADDALLLLPLLPELVLSWPTVIGKAKGGVVERKKDPELFALGGVVRYWRSNWLEGLANTIAVLLLPYLCTNPFGDAASSVSYSGRYILFLFEKK